MPHLVPAIAEDVEPAGPLDVSLAIGLVVIQIDTDEPIDRLDQAIVWRSGSITTIAFVAQSSEPPPAQVREFRSTPQSLPMHWSPRAWNLRVAFEPSAIDKPREERFLP